MSKSYPHIAARVFDQPLLIEHSKLVKILEVLGPRLGFEAPVRAMDDEPVAYQDPVSHLDGMLQTSTQFEARDEGHYVGNGVAVIPIIGALVQRSDWMTNMSGMMSYGSIERMVNAAMDDPMVSEIMLEFDSPGGEVAGAFDLADRMVALRGHGKTITAIAHEFAASAAYLIASTADEIVLPRTGAVGSIGVVAAHFDYSKAMEKRGVAVTYVYAGDKKVEGNPYQPLSESAKQDWQDEVDGIYRMFVETVAKNRGMTAESVIGTKAGMFTGAKAVERGLANRVNTFSNELSNSILRARNPSYQGPLFGTTTLKETEMSNVAEMEAKAKAEAEAKAKAEQEAKQRAEAEVKAKADATADQVATAVKADRERSASILALDEAKGREALAQHLAKEGMSVDGAKAILAVSPKASGLAAAMAAGISPGIRGDEAPEPQTPVVISATAIYAARRVQAEKARTH